MRETKTFADDPKEIAAYELTLMSGKSEAKATTLNELRQKNGLSKLRFREFNTPFSKA